MPFNIENPEQLEVYTSPKDELYAEIAKEEQASRDFFAEEAEATRKELQAMRDEADAMLREARGF